MKKKSQTFKKAEYFLPARYRDYIKQQILYAGFDESVSERFIGFSITFFVILTAVVAFDLWIFGFGSLSILLGLTAGVLFLAIINIAVVLIADARAREIEEVLPDALQLIASNVRAGMTIDKAIWLSARPEFGILEEEIRKVGAKSLGGTPIREALFSMTEKIKSNILDRAVRLIVEGMESGGELASLLEETSIHIRTSQALKQEIRSSVMMYTIFIFFATVLGAPFLFAISLFFVEIMNKLWGPELLQAAQTLQQGLLKISAPQITGTELFYFAIAALIITSFFGSLIIGLIQYGQEKRGLKYLPLLMGGSIAVFFIARFVLGLFFGSLFAL